MPSGQRTIEDIFVPFETEKGFEQQPDRQQNAVGIFKMKMRRIKDARPSSFSKQRPKRSQPAVIDEPNIASRVAVAFVRPNPNIRATQMLNQRLHVNCDAPKRRRQWAKEYNSPGHLQD